MSQKYNAFISYKHSPLDSKIASEIQRQLEKFRIPTDIKKASGITKISRIFRDKEELPLTSDLTSTIESALLNSEHLIVICSNATKDSMWVQREIDFFLKTHNREQILIVVTEGEPSDVIPEILKHKEVEITNNDGVSVTTKEATEFLACDYRGTLKDARKKELPRLVAALLGCNYDDLIKRQKQYKKRKLTATISIIGTILVLLTGYFAWSNYRINYNYKQSLLNQSEYLAAESEKLYNDGDRLSAALLALEGLPTNGQDRPLSSNALNALSQAIYAYRVPGLNDPLVNRSFVHEGDVTYFVLSDDQKYLSVVYDYRFLSVWDTTTGKEIINTSYPDTIWETKFTKENNLVILAEKFECYNVDTAQKIWSIDETYGSNFAVVYNKNQLVINGKRDLLLVDIRTGKTVKSINVKSEDDSNTLYLTRFSVSPDEKFVAASESDGRFYIFDIEKGEFVTSTIKTEYISQLMFTSSNNLVITSRKNLASESVKTVLSGKETVLLEDSISDVHCFDIKANTKWKTQLKYNQLVYSKNLLEGTIKNDDGTSVSAVFLSCSNICLVINAENGETLHTINMPDSIVDIVPKEDQVYFILTGGDKASYSYADALCFTQKYYIDNVEIAKMGEKDFVVSEYSSTVYMYEDGLYDTNWKTYFDNKDELTFGSNGTQLGNYILFKDNVDSNSFLYCFDIKKGDIIWTTTVEGYTSSVSTSPIIIPTDNDDVILFVTSKALYKINLTNGKSKVLLSDNSSISFSNIYYHEGYAYYMSETLEEKSQRFRNDLCRINIDSYNTEIVYKDIIETYYRYKAFVPNSIYLFWGSWDDDTTVNILINDKKQQITDIAKPELTLITEDGSKLIFLGKSDILIYDNTLKLLDSIPLNGKIPTSMSIHNDELLVSYESDELIRYNLTTAMQTGVTELRYGYSTGEVVWDYTVEDKILINAHSNMNIIDAETWDITASVDYCAGFDYNNNSAILFAIDPKVPSKDMLGYFEIYSPEELIKKAQLMLNDVALTEKQKLEYGLSE